MNNPNPSDDSHAAIREALRRDAARIQEPPFDAALHRAVMLRIRATADSGAPRWIPRLAWVAALVLLVTCAGLWFSRGTQDAARRPPFPPPDFSALLAATRTSAADFDTSSMLPAWMSPTASLLEPLHLELPNNRQPL